jgi:uncharacterized protein YbaR (Trm112 family)
MVCPACKTALVWTRDEATCTACDRRYPSQNNVWDFTFATV